MAPVLPVSFKELYIQFNSPISAFDCGEKCAPYNEQGVPFCCDTRHLIPTAYKDEWRLLDGSTDLWRLVQPDEQNYQEFSSELPGDQVLIACLGHKLCQREYRAISCRAFPFFPYITSAGDFIGMSYYWEFEDRCWVISHLDQVKLQYRDEFMKAFDKLLQIMPEELDSYQYNSMLMRRVFKRKKRAILLMHRNGFDYKVTPGNGRMRRIVKGNYPRFGVYKIAERMAFPEELIS